MKHNYQPHIYSRWHKKSFVYVVFAIALLSTGHSRADVYRDKDGWTVVKPSRDTRRFYVSSSIGSDGYPGQFPRYPLKSIHAGMAKLRDGYPDHLLLKRGDVWTITRGINIRFPGRSKDEPMLIGAYGKGARPLLKTRMTNGISIVGGGNSNRRNRSNIVVQGVHLLAYQRDYTSQELPVPSRGVIGIRFLYVSDRAAMSNILIEDVKVEYYSGCAIVQGSKSTKISNVIIRRSIFNHCYSTNSHSQGLYASYVDGLLIEENVFYHNGWGKSRDGKRGDGAATIFNHNMYIQRTNRNVVIRGNISADASSHGIQLRPGGVLDNNLFVRNPINIFVSRRQDPPFKPSVISNNVILEPVDINADLPRGWGIELKTNGAQVINNIISNDTFTASKKTIGIALIGTKRKIAEKNTIKNNIFYKYRNGYVAKNKHALNNDIKQNIYWDFPANENNKNEKSDNITFSDPTRNLASYNARLGGIPDYGALMKKLIERQGLEWDKNLTAKAINSYIQQGFELAIPGELR